MKKGDPVEILTCIATLQPHIYDEKLGYPFVKKTQSQYGKITYIDGGYIYVRPKGRVWTVECYDSELRVITEEEYKKSKNYRRL